eukprot:9487113-Pyramimonas_sp.AAC.1
MFTARSTARLYAAQQEIPFAILFSSLGVGKLTGTTCALGMRGRRHIARFCSGSSRLETYIDIDV